MSELILVTKDMLNSELNDPSKNYSFLRKVKVTEVLVHQETKTFSGTLSVEEINTGVKRDYPSHPITMLFQFFGDGYGAYGMPSVGDVGYIGFLGPGIAVYLGSTPFSMARQTRTDTNFNKMRSLKSGEYCIKSKKGAEVFLDDNGAVKIILNEASDSSRPNNYNTEYASLTVDSSGFTYTNENGSITMTTAGKLTVTGTAAEMLGSNALALLSDLNTLISTFNTHMHPTAALGSPSVPIVAATSPVGTTKLKGS